jgi:hypothetical protein
MGFDSRQDQFIHKIVQTGPGPTQSSVQSVLDDLYREKDGRGREVDDSPSSNAKAKHVRSYTSIVHVCLYRGEYGRHIGRYSEMRQ